MITDRPNTTLSSTCVSPSPLALTLLLLGGFIIVFDLFVVNVAIPAIQTELNASFSQIGWVIAGYELAFGVLLIAAGRLGDRYGRRRLFLIGMLAFSAASLLCAVAETSTHLVFARLLQGATGAILFPQIYALLRVMYDDNGRRRAFALLGMTLGLAAIAGQVLGGLIVESNWLDLGWRMVFVINLPIGIVTVLLARAIPESRAANALRVDWLGIGLATLGLLLMLLPLLEGPNSGWPRWTLLSIVFSLIVLTLFVVWQARLTRCGVTPAIDLSLFHSLSFNLGSLVVLLIYSSATSLFLCLVLLLQFGLGLSPFMAGMLFAPASLGFVAASLLAPALVMRFGNISIAVGALLYSAGIGGLILTVQELSHGGDVYRLLPALIAFGFGQGLSMTPLLNLILVHINPLHAGMAAGFTATVQQVGGAFGVAIVGVFFVNRLAQDSSHLLSQAERYSDAFSTAMIYNLLATLVASGLIVAIGRLSK